MAKKLPRSGLVRNVVKGFKLVPGLEKAISEHGDSEWVFDYGPKSTDDAWHPSSDCTPSPYELYQKAQGKLAPWVITGSLRKSFMVGHFWHQWLQYLVRDKLEWCEPSAIERRGAVGWTRGSLHRGDGVLELQKVNFFTPYHWVTGSGDIAPCSIPRHGDFLVDFKTMKSADFKMMIMPEWAAAKYEAQINCYMDFFDLERGLIVAINKDSPHDMKEFIFTRNQPLIDALYYKWRLVSECLDQGVEPPKKEDVRLPLKGPG